MSTKSTRFYVDEGARRKTNEIVDVWKDIRGKEKEELKREKGRGRKSGRDLGWKNLW